MAVLLFLTCIAAAQTQDSQDTNKPFVRVVPLTAKQLKLLRPVVERDLKPFLKTFLNDEPDAAAVEEEFLQSQYTPMNLGALGPAILVEAHSGQGATGNSALVNLYVPSHGSYRRIISTAGWGPEIGDEKRAVPDLIFGWASGVCHATLQRFRYVTGEYKRDACDQEVQDEQRGACEVKSCEKSSLPTFPDPAIEAEKAQADDNSPPPPSPYFTDVPRTGAEILKGRAASPDKARQ